MSDDALALSLWDSKRSLDPLASFEWASDSQRRVCELVAQGVEVHHRAANLSGKTHGGAGIGVGITRGLPALGGVRLPRFPGATVGAVLVPTYKQQVDSSQAAYLRLLGEFPHDITYVRRGVVDTIHVGESRIVFVSQDSGRPDAVKGQRWDWVHGDEPPDEDYWREARKNARYRWITETPLSRSEWDWIKRDFDGTLNHTIQGRHEVTSSVYDNRFLTPRRIKELEEAYRNDPYREARLYGHYCDVEGLSPFAPWWGVLQRWQSECRPGTFHEFTVRADQGMLHKMRVEVWEAPIAGERYYGPIDPSRGVPGNDPSAIHIWRRSTGTLVARFGNLAGQPRSGYATPYSLGALGAALSRMYGNALMEPEVTGGYGDAVLIGLRQNGCINIGRDTDDGQPGKVSQDEGFKTTSLSRPLYFAAIQRRLEEAGNEPSPILSADAISSLMSVKLDEYGRPEERNLRHGEDVILAGRALHVLGRIHKPVPKPVNAWTAADLMRHGLGMKPTADYPWPTEEAF